MEKYIGVLGICTISGIFAALVHMFLTDRWKKHFKIKNVYFCAIVFYGAMSVVKTVTGEGEKTLFSSFQDIEPVTYIHYGVPLAIMVLVFLIMTTEFSDEENNVVVFVLDWFDGQIMDNILEQTPDFAKKSERFH